MFSLVFLINSSNLVEIAGD